MSLLPSLHRLFIQVGVLIDYLRSFVSYTYRLTELYLKQFQSNDNLKTENFNLQKKCLIQLYQTNIFHMERLTILTQLQPMRKFTHSIFIFIHFTRLYLLEFKSTFRYYHFILALSLLVSKKRANGK